MERWGEEKQHWGTGEEMLNEVLVVLELCLLKECQERCQVCWKVSRVGELPSWALPGFLGEQGAVRARLCSLQECGACAVI